jgi:predicted nuclease of predicted toxin-antitoxin system
LCDESFPGIAIAPPRAAGHDVSSVTEISPGIPDSEVMALAISQQRILLTFDKDFGALTSNPGDIESSGVILFRLPPAPAASIAAWIVALLKSRSNWRGNFSVVEQDRVRVRRWRRAGRLQSRWRGDNIP